ncbi:hypothetical protein QYF36_011091 [Acer negundo]|nr:hypothetical protein QYF36_011091 [Acer negundo]
MLSTYAEGKSFTQTVKHVKNVRWAFADVVCNYFLGQNSCALYLRFELQYFLSSFGIICYIQITFITVKGNYKKKTSSFVLFCAMLMCLEERVRYLEMIKVYESKPADLIQGQMDTFHEPFKLAVSSHPPIPETPVLKDAEKHNRIRAK